MVQAWVPWDLTPSQGWSYNQKRKRKIQKNIYQDYLGVFQSCGKFTSLFDNFLRLPAFANIIVFGLARLDSSLDPQSCQLALIHQLCRYFTWDLILHTSWSEDRPWIRTINTIQITYWVSFWLFFSRAAAIFLFEPTILFDRDSNSAFLPKEKVPLCTIRFLHQPCLTIFLLALFHKVKAIPAEDWEVIPDTEFVLFGCIRFQVLMITVLQCIASVTCVREWSQHTYQHFKQIWRCHLGSNWCGLFMRGAGRWVSREGRDVSFE